MWCPHHQTRVKHIWKAVVRIQPISTLEERTSLGEGPLSSKLGKVTSQQGALRNKHFQIPFEVTNPDAPATQGQITTLLQSFHNIRFFLANQPDDNMGGLLLGEEEEAGPSNQTANLGSIQKTPGGGSQGTSGWRSAWVQRDSSRSCCQKEHFPSRESGEFIFLVQEDGRNSLCIQPKRLIFRCQ